MQGETPASTPAMGPPPEATQAHGTPTATQDEKTLAAVSYVLTWVTGLIIFLVAKKEQKYARWHAIQAIGLGIVLAIVGIVLNIVAGIAGAGAAFNPAGAVGVAMLFTLLIGVFWILTIVLIILLAVKAYQGTPIRLPVLADFADKNA